MLFRLYIIILFAFKLVALSMFVLQIKNLVWYVISIVLLLFLICGNKFAGVTCGLII